MTVKHSDLMVSVSGIRGIVGQSFTPDVVLRYTTALGTLPARGAEFILGRDTRSSGPWISNLVAGTLRALGHHVVDVGVCATPTLGYAVRERGAAFGVMVTASHNPEQWNALKFLGDDGGFVAPVLARRIFAAAERSRVPLADHRAPGNFTPLPQLTHTHMKAVLRLVRPRRAGRALRVVLDTVNGAGCILIPEFLRKHGCRLWVINGEPHGRFAHAPEPVANNLRALRRAVVEHGADLGIAVDPDADRVAFVDECGRAIGEELSLGIATRYVLARRPGPVVVNLSTSRISEDVARAYGQRFYRTPVGEAHVARRMRQVGAVIGGEGNGGVIYPALHPGRDALVGIAFLLGLLRQTRQPLSELARSLPAWHLVRSSIPRPRDYERKLRRFTTRARGGRVDSRDGIRIDWPDGWIQMRRSNTEPIVRILAEARTVRAARALLRDAQAGLSS